MSTQSNNSLTLTTHNVDETHAVGEMIGRRLEKGDLVALVGGLGSGKTQLVKGMAGGLGIGDTSFVTSPTYKLINVYGTGSPRAWIFHMDAHRIGLSDSADDLIIDEARESGAIVFLEWADRLKGFLSEPTLLVEMEITGEPERFLKLTDNSGGLAALFDELNRKEINHGDTEDTEKNQ